MKKILIIGSKGMAGHMLYTYLKEESDFEIIDIARGEDFFVPNYQIDVTNFKSLKDVLDKENPDVVINCIGVLNNDAETNPDKAILLNCYLPHFLAKAGDENKFKLIHISTDCVFNGKTGGYLENSFKDGIGFYAQTKALGEVLSHKHLTFRTSIIGPELKENGIGLFNWFMHQKNKIQGFTQAFWTGVTTLELAKAVKAAILQDLTGLHHLVNEEKINKFDLLNLLKLTFNKDILIESNDNYKVDKSLIKTNHNFNYTVPSYKKMLEDSKNWIILHRHLYKYKF